MLHKLDFTETNKTADPVVDDERLMPNNQPTRTSTVSSSQRSMQKPNATATIILSIIAIAAGVATGFGGHKLFAKTPAGAALTGGSAPIAQVASGSVKEGDVFGSKDKDSFKDNTKGYLEKGGIDGEGSHHLVRPGGPSQTVYLTSSVTDLDKFDGMEVEVWGETLSSKKAGWLMDVGRVQVVKVQGEKPEAE